MNQSKILIAITGGIGAGKSSVCRILQELGEVCISCDEINAGLLQSDDYINGLKRIFPEAFIGDVLDKNTIKKTITISDLKRKALNEYSHGKIKEKMLQEVDQCEAPRVFIEVPVLNQTDYATLFDSIWVIEAIDDIRLARLRKRDGVDENFAKAMMNIHSDNYNFGTKTIILQNNGNIEDLKNIVKKLL